MILPTTAPVSLYSDVWKRPTCIWIQVVWRPDQLGSDKEETFNTLSLRQNGRHFADSIFKCIFLNENMKILIKMSLKFISMGPINNIPALVQTMARCRKGDKPLSETMLNVVLVCWRIHTSLGLNEAPSHYMNQCGLITGKVQCLHLRIISWEIPQPLVRKFSLKITHRKCLQNLSGTNLMLCPDLSKG